MVDYRFLMLGGELKREVIWPFSESSVFIRVPTEYDDMLSSEYVDKYYKDRLITYANVNERNSLKQEYLLWLCIVDENSKQVFPDFHSFMKACTEEIAGRLYAQLVKLKQDTCPAIDDIPDEKLNELTEQIKKKPDIISTISDFRMLKKLMHFMVSLLVKQQPVN